MGETVHCESFLPLMRDLSEDSNSCSWSMYCGDKNLPYGQYQNGFSMRPVADSSYAGYERDFLKQTMIEHEAVFKNQVSNTSLRVFNLLLYWFRLPKFDLTFFLFVVIYVGL